MNNLTFLKCLLAYWAFNLGVALLLALAGAAADGFAFIYLYDFIMALWAVGRTFVRCTSCSDDWQHLRATVRTGTIWHKYHEIL